MGGDILRADSNTAAVKRRRRMLYSGGVALVAVVMLALVASCSDVCSPCDDVAGNGLFAVDVEQGERVTTAGDSIAYCLFIPRAAGAPADPPYPAVVISHGFARGKQYHAETACALAQRGFIVLTPNLVSLLGGEPAQLRNIDNLADHVRWLRGRAADETDALSGMLDPERIGLVGHSAGGSISFEAAIELAAAGDDAAALMLLDGVPWERTIDRAADLTIATFASVRSEPGDCNRDGHILEDLSGLNFSTREIRVVGATHCDPESPTDFLCELACSGSDEQVRAAYQELIYAFLHDVLAAPDIGAASGYDAVVARLAGEARVVATEIGGP